jgi:OOP family OmpA-OmpF porin
LSTPVSLPQASPSTSSSTEVDVDTSGDEPDTGKIVLRSVHFDSGSTSLRDVDKPVLNETAETLKANPNVRIGVNGFTDATGNVANSLLQSQREAEVVAAYLENLGILADRMLVQGFGQTHFVATNESAIGRSLNRRVELVPIN